MSRTVSRVLSLAFIGCALALVPSFARAAFVNLGPAGDFNVFVFNNNTQSGSDAHGKIGVGGNANFGSFTIASALGSGTDNLIVGGNYSNNGASLKGGMLVGGNVNWTGSVTTNGRVRVNGNVNFADGGVGSPVLVAGTYTAPGYFTPNTFNDPPNNGQLATFPFSFTDVADYLTDQADFMASLPFNGTTTIAFGGITLNGTDANFNNFYITAADLAAGTGLTINAPAGSTVVLNVDGSPASFDNMGISLNGVTEHKVLYNFYNATNLTIAGIGVRGSLLAPRADVNFSGNIDGTMIAKNLTGQGESHLFLFNGNLPPQVPEPATIALLGLALTGLTAVRRR
jgi:choice-of-anchor A domain-containing protein